MDKLELLSQPLPDAALKQHPTKSFLSTINAMYVIERLNEVFGLGKWFWKTEIIKEDGQWVVVKGHLTVPSQEIEIESYGGNDNKDVGDAYKGASTDALVKACQQLEIGADVYKDKQKPKSQQAAQPSNNKKWLNPNTPEWDKAIEYLKGDGSIEDIKAKYAISKANQEKLISEAI